MMNKIHEAGTFHVGEYVFDEMIARGWTQEELAARMGGDAKTNYLCLDLLKLQHPEMRLGSKIAQGLANAFGTTASVWLGLDDAWRTHPTIAEKKSGV